LESLLKTTDNNRQSLLEQWRTSPTHSSSNSLVKALNKLENIRALGIGTLDVSKIPPIRLKSLAQNAFTVRVQAITRMPNSKRIAILVAFVYTLEATATDDILTILELLVKDLFSTSEREGKKERLRTLKDLDKAALQLSEVSRVVIDDNCDDSQVREQIWRLITKEKLTEVVKKSKP
jgi:hypothetical protein